MRALLLLICFAFSTPALAAPHPLGEDAPAAAKSRYNIGKGLYRKGRYAEAAAEFQAALAMHPSSARLAYNLARSAERAGKLEAAAEAYQTYLKLAPAADDRGQIEALLPVLRKQIQEQWPEVAVSTQPPGAQITVDGKPHAEPSPATLRLPPGAHTLGLSVEGYVPTDRALKLVAGQAETVSVALAPLQQAPPPTSVNTIVGWTGVGLGVAGLGAGLAFTMLTNQASSDAEDLTEDDPDRKDLESDHDLYSTLTVVGYGAGGALLVTGVVFLLLPEDSATALRPTANGLALSF